MSRVLRVGLGVQLVGAGFSLLLLCAADPSAAFRGSPESTLSPVSKEGANISAAPIQRREGESAEIAAPQGSPQSSRIATAVGDRALANLLVEIDRELIEIDTLLVSSHFHSVLALAGRTRDLFTPLEGRPELNARRARLEVMAATAEVALGRRTSAHRSMMRALQVEPALSLDERDTSPKVLELLREARHRAGVGEAEP